MQQHTLNDGAKVCVRGVAAANAKMLRIHGFVFGVKRGGGGGAVRPVVDARENCVAHGEEDGCEESGQWQIGIKMAKITRQARAMLPASTAARAYSMTAPSALSSEPFRMPGALAISPRKIKLSSREISTKRAPRYECMRLLL